MPFADHQGSRIYWTEAGSGPPLLLIMGLGYSHDMWHRTVPVLSKHFRTILFDNRGIGSSDSPPGPYSIAVMAGDAAAVLDSAGVTTAYVFGMSMGGMIAQEFALQYPHRVAKLVLGCTACGGAHAVRAAAEVTSVLLNRARMTPEESAEAVLPFIYDPHTPRALIDEDLQLRRRFLPTPDSYVAQLQAILAWQSYDRLPAIGAPTLVLHGESDLLVPIGNGELIARTIPNARWLPLPNASHIFMTDQPHLSHTAILDFLL